MRNPIETIINLIEKQAISFISFLDENGFQNTKAILNIVKEVEDIIVIFVQNILR